MDYVLFAIFMAVAALMAWGGMQFWNGKGLEYITLIDDMSKFKDGAVSKTCGIMFFVLAILTLLFAASALTDMMLYGLIGLVIGMIITFVVGYSYLYTKGRKKGQQS